MQEKTITNEQQVLAIVNPKTDKGKPVAVDGKPEWSIVSGDSISLQPSDDGKSCMLVSTDTLGVTQVMAEADADLGEGVETISEIFSITVAGARAANMGASLGTPELKPDPTPA